MFSQSLKPLYLACQGKQERLIISNLSTRLGFISRGERAYGAVTSFVCSAVERAQVGCAIPAGAVSCGLPEYLMGRLRPDCEHDSPVDLPSLEALENVIDRFERLRFDDCLHLAFRSKAQSLFQIEPSA